LSNAREVHKVLVAIPTHHFIVFSGGLHHRGISYEAKNVRLHSYVDFIGNTRKPPSLRTTQLMMKCCSIDAEE